MVKTSVGYSGGEKANPTYSSLGDHTETVEIEYDPAKISYTDLLRVFWSAHDPYGSAWNFQYRSAVFFHGEDQRRLALETRKEYAGDREKDVTTVIIPAGTFYDAEDYHQKYSLRRNKALYEEFRLIYPDEGDFRQSTAAARVNGLLAGYGTFEEVEEAVIRLGLSPKVRKRLLSKVLSTSDSRFCALPAAGK